MFPPSQADNINIEALSGICGSISIACWVVVFSPQIIENFRRRSADGLSLLFLIIWLAGDVFNILGAVLQGVLPTMIILAVYYTLADIVLLLQCFYYRGFTLSDKPAEDTRAGNDNGNGNGNGNGVHDIDPGSDNARRPTERTSLLWDENDIPGEYRSLPRDPEQAPQARRPSTSSFRERLSSIDGTHLSPATPLRDPPKPQSSTYTPPAPPSKPVTTLQKIILNAFVIALVCAAGFLGWYIGVRSTPSHDDDEYPESPAPLTFDLWGQIFGYLCAVLYLGSRLPQLLLNYKRKSTEGVSLLFFLFACIGNLTYVFSILAYSPVCESPYHCRDGEQGRIYARYILVNLSWLLGSFGTLVEDLAIFTQFFLYRGNCYDGEDEDEDEYYDDCVAAT
ncbi:hypothetical protein FQN54_005376 [Arachnomyces sp. PD_36]|nr:hypothetical protein FQN54_005376 [Arachnomyces sp. PD_36]